MIFLQAKKSYAQNFDINTLKKINIERNKKLDGTMCFISNTITPFSITEPLGLLAIGIAKHNNTLSRRAVLHLTSFAVNAICTYTLKHAIDRPRPAVTYNTIDALDNVTHYSFPSGHSSSAFCTATYLSLTYKKWYVVVPSYMYASAIAYSRMHMGVHYPSDVFVGAILGMVSSYATYSMKKIIDKQLDKHKILY